MRTITLSVLAAAALAACGGGNGTVDSGGGTTTASTLKMSGTAATGLALANASVEVKCATGTGSATTLANGTYSVSITDGTLPCMLKVTGEADGAPVTLHSVTEAGTTNGNTVTAVANVTPLTEMIVAQITGKLPSASFEEFSASTGSQFTQAELTNAVTAVVSALKTATGIDLGAIDPFKAPLAAATAPVDNNPDAYDKALDALKKKVPTEALPQIVTQIASAKSTGDSAPVTLTDVMTAVDRGSLAGCPIAVSGKYRIIDYWGRTLVRDVDFKNMKINRPDTGAELFTITADETKPCHFHSSGAPDGATIEIDYAIGAGGVGAYTATDVTNNRSVTGYIFPVQSHPLSAIAGTWTYLQSGYLPSDGVGHFPGQITFKADNSVSFCDYRPDNNWTCEPATDDGPETISARTDGGFKLGAANDDIRIYAYRAPSGSLTLFGTTNPAGVNDSSTEQTSFIAARLAPLTMPAVGDVSKYYLANLSRVNNVNMGSFSQDAVTVTGIDAAAGTFSRVRSSDSQPDSFKLNFPFNGARYRTESTWTKQDGSTVTIPAMASILFPGLAMSVSVDDHPMVHFHSISIARK